MGVLPFQNSIDLIELKGKDLKQVLNESASRLLIDGSAENGLLQVAGMYRIYSITGHPLLTAAL